MNTNMSTGEDSYPFKPLSGRRLSNIEQYKQRAAQKRQERIQGGGLAKQSMLHTSAGNKKRGGGAPAPHSTLQPLPPSNYSNPLAQNRSNSTTGLGMNVNSGRQFSAGSARSSVGGVGGGASGLIGAGSRDDHNRRSQGLTSSRTTTSGGAGAGSGALDQHQQRMRRAFSTSSPGSGSQYQPQPPPLPLNASLRSNEQRELNTTTTQGGSASSTSLQMEVEPLKLFQDVREHTKSNIEKELEAQGIRPVYEPAAHRERSAAAQGLGGNGRGREHPGGLGVQASVLADLSDKRLFLMQPGPKNGHVQCTIRREKGNFGMFPKYTLHLDENGEFLLAARKRKKSKSSNYLISLDRDDLSRQSGNYFGKLRSNFIGTEFVIFDKGSKPQDNSTKSVQPNVRSELGGVLYQYNILGTRGPRKMTVVIPSLDSNNTRTSFMPDQKGESIMDVFKKTNGESDDMIVYQNKSPAWNEQLGAFCLNFNGRVTEASVKNFQLVETDESDDIVCQFGKISDKEFTMDYKWPMSALQAFTICLTSFDGKLACE